MDKISTQKFNVNVKNSEMSKADDVLGALFSMPVLTDEKKINGKKCMGRIFFASLGRRQNRNFAGETQTVPLPNIKLRNPEFRMRGNLKQCRCEI